MQSKTQRHRTPRSASLLLSVLSSLTAIALWTGTARALPIEASVGTGPDLATVVLEFEDGAGFVFEVLFDDAVPTTGIDVMQVLDAELPAFAITVLDFGFGLFIDGIAYDGHSNAGFGGGELWWHYWTKDDASEAWLSSPVGAADRIVTGGAFEGWVYGSAAEPLPEGGTGTMLALGLVLAAYRRRGGSASDSLR